MSTILTLIAILASSIGFAQDAVDALNDGAIDEIVSNKNTCVVAFSEDRIYLDPSRIFPTGQGLYLNLNDSDYILLPTLNSDSNGCYVPVFYGERSILNKCSGCGEQYFLTCKNKKCPLVKQNQEREREKERKKEEKKREKKK